MTAKPADEIPANPEPTSLGAEIHALCVSYDALSSVDVGAQRRALWWLEERLNADRRATERAAAGDEVPF